MRGEGLTGRKSEMRDDHSQADGDKGWASEKARWPGELLLLWYQGKDAQDISTVTGASKNTVTRILEELDPPAWGPEWRAWWYRMLLEQHAAGKPVNELSRIFKLDEPEIRKLLKEETVGSTVELGLPPELLNTPEYERWHKSVRHMRWAMEGDPFAITEGAFQKPWDDN